ncbi:PREDICTED: probable serine/threonine-protein kinase cdc7 [Ceratosolen solmsi marchali]|uniref:Probable serine/threonine-protein kinase cdc7 n=1 Tax=Ceratosolen solmsi marchali TaxID=326594 RepID=A0AAJ6YWW4_9HYME|nr:PREDICTED: probable serine/threonine-protein kinase cdc7 [Ceratosolen solmsi marchali]
MTRYARSKGSKSSNERLPNEPTPWYVMKQQLESIAEKEEVPQQKTKSAKQLLEGKEDIYSPKYLANIKTNWAQFENSPSQKNTSKGSKIEKRLQIQNKKIQTLTKSRTEKTIVNDVKNQDKKSLEYSENKSTRLKKLKRKNDNSNYNASVEKEPKNVLETTMNEEIDVKLKKRQKTKNESADSESNEYINKNDDTKVQNSSKYKLEMAKNWRLLELAKNFTNESKEYIQSNAETIFDDNDNNNKDENNRNNARNSNKNRKFNNKFDNIPKKFQKKTDRIKDDKHFRRKSDYGSMKITINGMDVEIVKYDGFPIIKQDAKRLIELRKTMILKGIPKLEIDAAMKLERRKCEKALTRIKKQVCFHCRKAGHNLSDCPELEKEEIITGICFKCGSTEHTHFECKVNKSNEYKYAKCFICREQGHIAKQCPDNPKGLYPDGGSCKICGDVTHLRKDCSELIKQKEDTAITLDTINDKNLELLDNEINKVDLKVKPSKKIVKF